MTSQYLEKILRARVYDIAKRTSLDRAEKLSIRFDNDIWIKREDQQPVFSFKLRGAYNKIFNLSDDAKQSGVVAASAGNHAQGVALAGKCLGVETTIVMPTTTPAIKVDTVRHYGGKAVLFGDSYDEAYKHAAKLAKKNKLSLIHPFDDPDVIAGQGTIAMELLQQYSDPIEAIFVPVGGGGLIAGISAYVKHIRPDTKVIGVEPEDSATLYSALKAGEPVDIGRVGLFADGVAVKKIGEETFRIAKECVDEVILVNTDEICAGIKDIFNDTRTVSEPAGALAVAGAKKYLSENGLTGKSVIALLSGANINFDRLSHVAERADVGEHKEALFGVTIPEKSGAFLEFCRLLGRRGVTEFNYRYADSERAHVFCGVELSDGEREQHHLCNTLESAGYDVVDLTHNDTAKMHIRHMVGGHAPGAGNEKIFRFVFAERPGALFDFLSGLTRGWNISLFHYRNHGAAYGRVLVGLQLRSEEVLAFTEFMQEKGYDFTDESDNVAYKLFALGG